MENTNQRPVVIDICPDESGAIRFHLEMDHDLVRKLIWITPCLILGIMPYLASLRSHIK